MFVNFDLNLSVTFFTLLYNLMCWQKSSVIQITECTQINDTIAERSKHKNTAVQLNVLTEIFYHTNPLHVNELILI